MSVFEALRALDDHDEPRSLRFAGTGLPMWPFVRWLAICAGQEAALGVDNISIAGHRPTARERIELLARATLRGPLTAGRTFEHVMVSTTAGTVLQRDDRWFDRINDYFVMEAPEQSLVLDMAQAGGYKTPRFPPHVRCYDTFDFQAGVLARMIRPRDADLASIARLVAFVRERIPVDAAALDHIHSTLVHWATRLPILHRLWSRFFARVRPRVLFIEGGSYGNFAHVYTWARERGIATAEFQHGLISQTHLAYNYGDAAQHDGALARCLPQHLLLYGEVWKSELRTPSQLAVVGNPHFAESARAIVPAGETTVIISQGYCTDLMVRATDTLARRFREQRFVFRPHPGELPFREKYAALASLPNVAIAERGDLYDLLGGARAVVGHSSTALLEAAGLGLPVFIFDDELSRATLPSSVGTWVKTVDELVALAETPRTRAFKPDDFFARDWRERYARFVASLP